MRVFADLYDQLQHAELWVPWLESGLRVLMTVIGAWLITRIASGLLGRLRAYATSVMEQRGFGPDPELQKRTATIVAVCRMAIASGIWVIALVMVLIEMGFKIEPLLASLGVAGLALGLGAQTLIKDWLGGLFLLLEDQIRIGDSATINGFSGVVTEINLRTTVLRAENGAVYIIANGSITVLANLTREYSYYIFETILAHQADANKALEILEQTGVELTAEEAYKPAALAPIEVMGVDRLGEHGATIRARLKTLPSAQYLIGRELNRRIKQRFDAAGILFPPP
ncbi:MAG TPA: mechanosensitive ion channel family protein [Bryobacteraceae bacterium]|jgi:small conductance mechanosensitive channel